jgi:integrase
MSGREKALYVRGKYWLDWDTKADGTRRSPCLTIFWYDEAKRRVCSASTRTADLTLAEKALDRRFLADRGESNAYCEACGQPLARAAEYLLTDAIADYRTEWGDLQSSADSIRARLSHVVNFLEQDREGPGLATSCAEAATTPFIRRFRAWSQAEPVTWKNGKGEVTVSRPRAPSTTEESVVQLMAALNHACDADPPRSTMRPTYSAIGRKKVSPRRKHRISDVGILAAMLEYAKDNRRRRPLHAFLVASLCTIARPDAIVDISTDPARRQWHPGSPTIDLNPAGRIQTKKYRPMLPVLEPLAAWLDITLRMTAPADEALRRDRTGGWLVNYYGRPVQNVESAWDAMLVELGLPRDREWKPYILRHSLAQLCRAAGVVKWDLQGFMGHVDAGQTETYAPGGEFASVTSALNRLLESIDTLRPGALHRSATGPALKTGTKEAEKMT